MAVSRIEVIPQMTFQKRTLFLNQLRLYSRIIIREIIDVGKVLENNPCL